jgi:hypothetical protein
VLAADVRFEGFTATDWMRVLALFRPRRAGEEDRDPNRPRGGVIAVHAGGKLVKLVHTDVGRLRLDDLAAEWPVSSEQLARRHNTSWAGSLEAGTLEAIMDRFGARARRGDDVATQVITLFSLARDELAKGTIDLWPRRLRGVPIPTPGMVTSTLDTVCPRGRTLVLGLFEHGELWTSVALRRGGTGFDLVLGPDEVRSDMGLLAGDWRRDFRHLARAIEDRAGPIALGCYAEAATIKRLEVDPNPGAWARAAAVRDVILSPLPAPIAIPLGLDAGRAAFSALRTIAERLDPLGVVAPSLERLRDAVSQGDRDVAGVLGFQPLELLRRVLSRDH